MLTEKTDKNLRKELESYAEAWKINQSKEGKSLINASASIFLEEFNISRKTFDQYYNFYNQLKGINLKNGK